MKKTIGFYPQVRDQNDQRDLLSRLTWYLWPWRDQIDAVKLWAPPLPHTLLASVNGFDPVIERQYSEIRTLIRLAPPHEPASTALMQAPCDLVYVWKSPKTAEEKADVAALRQATEARGGMLYIVDRHETLNEGSFYLWGCHNVMGDSKALIEDCKRKFAKLKSRARGSRCYVYGTGPSLELMPQIDVSDGDSIVCNSIVANEALLDQTNPIAVVAGDPIFHAGCSQYAAGFREKLRHVLETRDVVFVTVMRDYVQQIAQLPKELHEKVIAIPFAPDKKTFLYDFENDFRVSPETNVLTLLLLPLAAALYDHISVAGCDGRPVTENQYFWSHHKGSQLSTDKMANIQEIHPAFFARSYDDHYSAHVADIDRIINELEDAGKRIDAITPSHIPALKLRHCWDVRAFTEDKDKPATLVSVNPDASTEYGHWIWYDRRMYEDCARRGIDFIALGNNKLSDALIAREPKLRRAFQHETWGAGNKPIAQISLARLQEFESSLRRSVSQIARERPDHDRVFYLYTGSIPHALAMYRVARDNPQDFFVVNTFWTSVFDCEADGYLQQFGEFLRKSQAQSNFRVLALTRQLKAIIANETSVDLPLAPHPNPSMPRPRATATQCARDKAFTVLLPGGMTEEKGFRDIPGILQAIRNTPALDDAELVVRATRVEGGIKDGREDIIGNIELLAKSVDAVMDDVQFLDWLSSADIAILPYREDRWRYRNSALVIDLLYLGVPVVCCRGTWLADVVETFGGGVTVDGSDPKAYAGAIETIRAELETYKQSARRAAQRYHASNNWPQLIDTVMSVAVGAGVAPTCVPDADKFAPINWWSAEGQSPPTGVALEAPKTTVAAAQADNRPRKLEHASSLSRFVSFAVFQLTQSRRVQTLMIAACALLALSMNGAAAIRPIQIHLTLFALVAASAGCALIILRFLVENAAGVRTRLQARSGILADVVSSAGLVLTARGFVKRLATAVLALSLLAWLSVYTLRLLDLVPQLALELTFWGGGIFAALSATALLSGQIVYRVAHRLYARWTEDAATRENERLQHAATRASHDIRQAITPLSDCLHKLSSRVEHLNGLSAAMQEVEVQLAQLKVLSADQVRITKATNIECNEVSREVVALREAIKTAQSGIEAEVNGLRAEFDVIRDRVQGLGATMTTHVAAIGDAQDKIKVAIGAVSQDIKTQAGKIPAIETNLAALANSGFHVVGRHMSQADLDALASTLSNSFNIRLTGRNLGYLGNRIRDLESSCLGRIAAPLPDALVRTAALLSVKSKEASVLEIGALFGLGAIAMRELALPQFERVRLTFIDPLTGYYAGAYESSNNDIVTGVPVSRESLLYNLQKAMVPKQDVRIIQAPSEDQEAIRMAAEDTYDVVIIDGDHSYEGVRRDFVNYAPMVREGGFIIFDDYGLPEWQGVTDFVDELIAEEPLRLQKVLLSGKTMVLRIRAVFAHAESVEASSGVIKDHAALSS